MTNVNRQGPAPSKRRSEAASGIPHVTQRSTVPIRRNVENYADPYIPRESQSGTVVCKECRAVYQQDRWSLDEKILAEAVGSGDVRYDICPACEKLRDRQPGGIVTLCSDFIALHREEILNLIHNEDTRARNVNPLERVMEIRDEGENQLIVTTTNEKLAQRIGRALYRAYNGQVQYQWMDDSKQARVRWTR